MLTNRKASLNLFFKLGLGVALTAILFLATTPLSFPQVAGVSDKFNHALAFLVLSWLADRAFPEKPFWTKVLWLMGYGIGIECIQYFIPFREFSVLDMAADGAGIIIYRAANSLMKQIRIRNGRKRI